VIRIGAAALAAILAVAGLAVVVVLLIGLPSRAPRPCPATSPVQVVHRGDVTEHPPNTLGAVLDAAARGGVELDVTLLADDTVVLFHDHDTERITGVPGPIGELDAAAVAELRTRTEIDGRTYARREPIPTLAQTLDAVCTTYPSAWVYIDVKTETGLQTTDWTSRMFDRTLQVWSDSPCARSTPTLFGVGHPFATAELRGKLDALDRPNVWLETFAHPGNYPLGEAFWLQLGAPHAVGQPDVFGAHYTIWEAHPDLARRYASQGYCIAVYGAGPTQLDALEIADVVHFRTVDLPEGHVHQGDHFTAGGITYTPDWTAWWVFLLAASVWTTALGGLAGWLGWRAMPPTPESRPPAGPDRQPRR